jgi:hypothetical protein
MLDADSKCCAAIDKVTPLACLLAASIQGPAASFVLLQDFYGARCCTESTSGAASERHSVDFRQ